MKKTLFEVAILVFATVLIMPLPSYSGGVATPLRQTSQVSAADLTARSAAVLPAGPRAVLTLPTMPTPADPLYIQLGVQGDQVSRMKTDFRFVAIDSSNSPNSYSTVSGTASDDDDDEGDHCNDGPDDPLGCLDACAPAGTLMSPSAKLTAGFVRSGEDKGYGALIGNRPTIYEALHENLPQGDAAHVTSLLKRGYMAEFAALGIKNIWDFLNAPRDAFCNCGKALQKYDVSMGAWDAASVIVNARLKTACGIELNMYELTDSGLTRARRLLGNSRLRNLNHREAIEMIRRGM